MRHIGKISGLQKVATNLSYLLRIIFMAVSPIFLKLAGTSTATGMLASQTTGLSFWQRMTLGMFRISLPRRRKPLHAPRHEWLLGSIVTSEAVGRKWVVRMLHLLPISGWSLWESVSREETTTIITGIVQTMVHGLINTDRHHPSFCLHLICQQLILRLDGH